MIASNLFKRIMTVNIDMQRQGDSQVILDRSTSTIQKHCRERMPYSFGGKLDGGPAPLTGALDAAARSNGGLSFYEEHRTVCTGLGTCKPHRHQIHGAKFCSWEPGIQCL